jgi:nitroreductase
MLTKIKNKIRNLRHRIKSSRPLWLRDTVKNKLVYKFDALYWGIKINKQEKVSLHNFRRNIHRIEKGLSYKKTKEAFAEDYIAETVNYLKNNDGSEYLDSETVSWGVAVLHKYFKVCTHTERIGQAYTIFNQLSLDNISPDSIPYTEMQRPKLSVDYDALYQLALRRRSVRYFTNQKVELSVVEKAMAVARMGPSSCNRQSFRFLFYNEPELVKKLSAIPGGVRGYELPNIIVMIGRYRGYFDERDINAPLIDASLAAMGFLFAAETLGLGTVCINWPNVPVREQKIREVIHLEKDEFVIMLIGLGYPDPEGKIPYSGKKCMTDLFSVNDRIKK